MHITRQINSDCQKLRRFALQLLASGYLQRYIQTVDLSILISEHENGHPYTIQ